MSALSKQREYTEAEVELINKGKRSAYLACLRLLCPDDAEAFEALYYSCEELERFCSMQIEDYRNRLEKARKIYLVQSQVIKDLSQLSI